MAFGAEHVKPSLFRHAISQFDIGPPPGHVGGNGYGPFLPRLRDDVRFPFMLLCIQQIMIDPSLIEQATEFLRLINVRGTDQHRTPFFLKLLHFVRSCFELFLFRTEKKVGVLGPAKWLVCWNHHHLKVVNLIELVRLGCRGTGHSGEFVVHLEIVLKGNGGEGLILLSDIQVFLGLHGLVKSVTPPSPFHKPARELVHDHDLSPFDNIFLVPLIQLMGTKSLFDMMRPVHVLTGIETVDADQFLGTLNAFLGEYTLIVLLVDFVMFILVQRLRHAVRLVILLGRFVSGTRDNKRGPGFVNKNVIHLVDDGEMMT